MFTPPSLTPDNGLWMAPYFAPYATICRQYAPMLGRTAWITQFNTEFAPQVFLEPHAMPLKAIAYESLVYASGAIPTRMDSMHDLMNAAVWARFPHSKRQLNLRHINEGMQAQSGNHRSRLRDGLTLFDEVGVIIECDDPQLRTMHADHAWHTLFVENRHRWHADIQITIFGHGLLESLVTQPHLGMIGKALWFPAEIPAAQIDTTIAEIIAQADQRLVQTLLPLPIFGVPGWHCGNSNPAFYDDQAIFRPRRNQRRVP